MPLMNYVQQCYLGDLATDKLRTAGCAIDKLRTEVLLYTGCVRKKIYNLVCKYLKYL